MPRSRDRIGDSRDATRLPASRIPTPPHRRLRIGEIELELREIADVPDHVEVDVDDVLVAGQHQPDCAPRRVPEPISTVCSRVTTSMSWVTNGHGAKFSPADRCNHPGIRRRSARPTALQDHRRTEAITIALPQQPEDRESALAESAAGASGPLPPPPPPVFRHQDLELFLALAHTRRFGDLRLAPTPSPRPAPRLPLSPPFPFHGPRPPCPESSPDPPPFLPPPHGPPLLL